MMYTMSLPIYHATIYFILISVFDQTNGQNISIIRGERDVFTNPADCILAKAVCFDSNCTYCQCQNSRKTFVATRGKHGECVPNEYLDYVTSLNLSFLAQISTKKSCLVHYFRFVHVNTCNSSAISQLWLWTRNGQLLNLDLLECMTVEWNRGQDLILKNCVSNNNKQLWQCDMHDPYYIWQKTTGGYLSYTDHWGYEHSYRNRRKAARWKRYGSNKTLCSQAVGCDTFQDGTSLVVLNQTKCHENSECWGEKEIKISMNVKNCSLVPNKVKYIHKGEWQRLSFKTGSFDVVTNESKAFLKWDLAKTPKSWKGLIVKVQFQCGRDQHNQVTHCALIKYSGLFTGFDETDKQKDESKDGNDKTQITVIVVCVLIIMFVIAIAAFFAYRNKDRLANLMRKSTKKRGAERAEHISTTPSSGDSNNPIYNSSDKKYSAQNECDLYEGTKPEHVYHYANPVQEIEDSTPPNEPHDYALPDSSARLAEKMHEGIRLEETF